MLQRALENEVAEYLERHRDLRDEGGKRLVVGNGSLPEREVLTGAGPLTVRQPRARHRDGGGAFTSAILPPYLRRAPSVDSLIPALYLRGISTGDFTGALEAILGQQAAGLSATNIVRLKRQWEQEYKEWSHRDLSSKHYVYFWADGIHFNVRLEEDRVCILVIIGALADGTKELVSVWSGFRESTSSWQSVLRDLRDRGLEKAPTLAVGDGALGFWAAVQDVYPQTRHQRCWVHKTANILDKMPKSVQTRAKSMIHEIYMAATRVAAMEAYEKFKNEWGAKYPKACGCLEKDEDSLFTFYDFPAEHWSHIRTTNPIESTFATVRLRTRRTKGCGSSTATLAMVFQLVREAERHWRRLKGSQRIAQVIEGRRFVDGKLQEEKAA